MKASDYKTYKSWYIHWAIPGIISDLSEAGAKLLGLEIFPISLIVGLLSLPRLATKIGKTIMLMAVILYLIILAVQLIKVIKQYNKWAKEDWNEAHEKDRIN
ncbi:hypothetical protein OZX69_02895 [Lactobacillus sp. ESL0731]|uniref:hypothetical protein n=1 Tax=unclassified Lactobacillus TaxID=2620435 RepID=UPI0023F85B73|nr:MULTISPECIES: hypothetical protein [unclassified Lactobacillus]WEV51657.1 hypothetical protein OZX63_02895 [Lactobacillus sp. ESL0700]WEV62786.1 hypothetical protein OZX69_02895 [Lactobacillus sp. ESL0731]